MAGAATGFLYSLIGGGDRLSNLEPGGVGTGRISDGLTRTGILVADWPPNRTALPANSGLWPNVIRFVLANSEPVPAGEFFTAPLYHQSGPSAAGEVQFRIFLDSDFNPSNGNEIEIDQDLFPNTGTNGVALVTLDLHVNPATVAPGTYAIFAQAIDGARTRYLYAPEALTITPSLQPPVVDASSLARVGATLRFNVLAFPGQNVTVLATTDFIDWVPLQTHTFTGTVWKFIDADAGKFTRRFYRAALTP